MICFDSRKIKPGDIFLCLPNAHPFINEALTRGAKEITHCTRQEMAKIAADFFNNPSQTLTVIGVTGTNGKTTTTHITAHILNLAGFKAHIIGTLSGNLTTPESIELQEIMAEKIKQGYTHIIMEVSSIGIDQHRVDHIDFDIKLLTNVTQDHLDYHKTFEDYRNTKLYFMNNFPGKTIYPEDFAEYKIDISLPLTGKFNYLNAQAAGKICEELGITQEIIKKGLSTATPVPGRFECINLGQDFFVFVDYAHTPDGIQNILEGIIDFRKTHELQGSIITVFGCGGDRDRTKRPIMGSIAEELSDKAIITSDNPRSENPEDIISEILKGIKDPSKIKIEADRKTAIHYAIKNAKKGDIVLIAGKGHETYQIIGNQSFHFDDREEAAIAIKGLQA
ncbi:MAG: UDP-N-acetylmuramoyl-L-alanyl-D-glutamate--2,6-diaminopimelate ligase [Candidatus Margulisiibacteriota bacterium]|nr:MAG: UDP-N-acetylmuramoyl-L-alanyl-D-glutamate--2,6-diaminopimelate ligase [Candidatus Margulisiibacteriota bacterium]HAR62275.1 UDP-N-acetylmuramoyl-L-alanyl-D-glutamate--2,6-diaminopimelate ligase [Candidatus Margulisiibacteriota bacterium]HCT84311.1 UDP-N-acetylmuramoyl-L-alanyl-D-glutamate--2,6-diaminopimelate ligase [Candidatus Margulisiibacteriota bacterium]HCY37551.1 UDP-N-acetylmuramoyl-L-alanyl-D-glutamate--2,6-diaminopimelate ligase [Candidatus Margulisiibacteriota bacterium]